MANTFDLGNQVRVINKVANIDSNYGPYSGKDLPAALLLAHNTVGALREIGVTVGILLNNTITEYWYKSGTTLSDLVLKQSADAVSNEDYTARSVLVGGVTDGAPSPVVIDPDKVLGRMDGDVMAIELFYSLAGQNPSDASVASAKAVKDYVDGYVSSPFIPQGGYDASINSPNLDNWGGNNGFQKGYIWIVTVDGDFFTEPVKVGDYLIANKLNPLLLTDWTVVHNGLKLATETVPGIIEIATTKEATDLTLDSVAITPLKLKAVLGVTDEILISRKYSAFINPSGTTATTFTITHNLGTSDVSVSVRDTESPYYEVGTEVKILNGNSISVGFNLSPAANKYKVTIIG